MSELVFWVWQGVLESGGSDSCVVLKMVVTQCEHLGLVLISML